jgi:hypothetical protein
MIGNKIWVQPATARLLRRCTTASEIFHERKAGNLPTRVCEGRGWAASSARPPQALASRCLRYRFFDYIPRGEGGSMTGTLVRAFGGLDQVGAQVHLQWVIYFPWVPDQGKFKGEVIYSIRQL